MTDSRTTFADAQSAYDRYQDAWYKSGRYEYPEDRSLAPGVGRLGRSLAIFATDLQEDCTLDHLEGSYEKYTRLARDASEQIRARGSPSSAVAGTGVRVPNMRDAWRTTVANERYVSSHLNVPRALSIVRLRRPVLRQAAL